MISFKGSTKGIDHFVLFGEMRREIFSFTIDCVEELFVNGINENIRAVACL